MIRNINGIEFSIIPEFKETRNGFSHKCTITSEIGTASAKIGYINRVWEPYEFYSVYKKTAFKLLRKFREDTANYKTVYNLIQSF